MDDRPDVAADPSGRHRLADSHPAGSFEPLHPADVVQIVRFLERRRISQVDPRHKPAARFADAWRDTLLFPRFPVFADDCAQPILYQRSRGPSFRGSFSSRAVKKVLGEADGRALSHVS